MGRTTFAGWWWMAGAFAVSFVADSAAHVVNPWLIASVYPVLQSVIILAVLLPKTDAAAAAVLVTISALIAVIAGSVEQPTLLLPLVAWGAVALAGLGREVPRGLSVALLVYFAGGLVAWAVFSLRPSFDAYLAYQATRALGLALFCVAAAQQPGPVYP